MSGTPKCWVDPEHSARYIGNQRWHCRDCDVEWIERGYDLPGEGELNALLLRERALTRQTQIELIDFTDPMAPSSPG